MGDLLPIADPAGDRPAIGADMGAGARGRQAHGAGLHRLVHGMRHRLEIILGGFLVSARSPMVYMRSAEWPI